MNLGTTRFITNKSRTFRFLTFETAFRWNLHAKARSFQGKAMSAFLSLWRLKACAAFAEIYQRTGDVGAIRLELAQATFVGAKADPLSPVLQAQPGSAGAIGSRRGARRAPGGGSGPESN